MMDGTMSRAKSILEQLSGDAAHARVRGCTDPAQLQRWLSRVLTASTIGEVLAD
jgi:hypothetical protein